MMRVRWGYLLGAVFLGLVALGILAAVPLGDYAEKTYRNSRTGAVFTKSATQQRVEGALGGLFCLGVAAFFASRGVARKAGGASLGEARAAVRRGSASCPGVGRGPQECYLCGTQLGPAELQARVCHACRA
jgi:hypothetical protein